MNMDNDISDALDLTPIQPESSELVSLINNPLVVQHVEGSNEYETAKGNVENILRVGTNAMNDLLDLAKLSQDPRSYRVLTELLTAMTAANKDLMEIKLKEVEIRKKDVDSDGPQTVNNNLFVGSTSEILEILNKKAGHGEEA